MKAAPLPGPGSQLAHLESGSASRSQPLAGQEPTNPAAARGSSPLVLPTASGRSQGRAKALPMRAPRSSGGTQCQRRLLDAVKSVRIMQYPLKERYRARHCRMTQSVTLGFRGTPQRRAQLGGLGAHKRRTQSALIHAGRARTQAAG